MGTVDVDLEGLLARLHERDQASLPFQVTPVGRGADLVALLADVRRAANGAFELSRERHPSDPTTPYGEPSIAAKTVVAVIADGPMTDEEVTTWFTDFAVHLEGHRVRVVPQPVVSRIPQRMFDEWAVGPERVLTAFFYFTSDHVTLPNGLRLKHRDHALVEATAEQVVDLVRLPSGTPVVDRGDAEFITTPGRQADELRAHPADFLGVRQFTKAPPRYAGFKFGLHNDAWLQVHDESLSARATLDRLVAGLRTLGPWLDYAFVRRDRLVIPQHNVYGDTLHREPTDAEQRFDGWAAEQYAVAPSVAQVLNPRHLAQEPDLDAFTVEGLANGRALVVARDPDPWLSGLNPEPQLLLDATRAFGRLLPSVSELEACWKGRG
jgi:hypothetical protein